LQLVAVEPFGAPAKLAALQLLDDEPQPFDLCLRLTEVGAFGRERAHHPLQRHSIVRQGTIDVHEPEPGFDALLFNVVTVIELSDHDRHVTESRYQKLQPHVERPSSWLRGLLLNNVPDLPAGVDVDRRDDYQRRRERRPVRRRCIDVPVPLHWSNDEALDRQQRAG
jgi:hypothetical protein